jgi:hypothetical protein
MKERFRRAPQKALGMPSKPRAAPSPKMKRRPASKGAFAEAQRRHGDGRCFHRADEITTPISHCGAPYWADRLRTDPTFTTARRPQTSVRSPAARVFRAICLRSAHFSVRIRRSPSSATPRRFSIPDPPRRQLCEPIADEPFSCATIGCEQLRTVRGRLGRPHQASLEWGRHRSALGLLLKL